MVERRKPEDPKQNHHVTTSQGSMSISDLITPSSQVSAMKFDGHDSILATSHQESENSSALKKKRGRPKKIISTEGVTKKGFKKKIYVDTPQIREKILLLENFIDLYDQSVKKSGRPRVHPLKETLTRKKIENFPLDVQAKFKEYIDLKRLLPPVKPLGRPRKDSPTPEQQHPSVTPHEAREVKDENVTNQLQQLPVGNGVQNFLNPPSLNEIPISTDFPGRHPSAEVNNETSSTVLKPNKLPSVTSKKIIKSTTAAINNKMSSVVPNKLAKAVTEITTTTAAPMPRKRGRPPKLANKIKPTIQPLIGRKVGRPRKDAIPIIQEEVKIPKKRGRPRKDAIPIIQEREVKIPKKRGRPRKIRVESPVMVVKRPVGRPRKITPAEIVGAKPKKKVGRPRKNPDAARTTNTSSSSLRHANPRRTSRNSNPDLDPIQRLHYLIATDSELRQKLKTHFKDASNESISWGFVKQEASIHVSKMYLLLLLNPGLKDSVQL